jgi:hypothetical protein
MSTNYEAPHCATKATVLNINRNVTHKMFEVRLNWSLGSKNCVPYLRKICTETKGEKSETLE